MLDAGDVLGWLESAAGTNDVVLPEEKSRPLDMVVPVRIPPATWSAGSAADGLAESFTESFQLRHSLAAAHLERAVRPELDIPRRVEGRRVAGMDPI